MTKAKKGVSLQKISRMEYLTFRNAIRLHLDSICLFGERSYPSTLFLSVLAQEELGKATLLSDFVFHSEVDGRMDSEWEQKWLDMIYHHRVKQGAFSRNAMYDLPEWFVSTLSNGKLEQLKQASVYVGFQKRGELKSRLSLPFNITKMKTTTQITIVNDYLRVLALGVSKHVYGWDNPRIERLLNKKLVHRFSLLWKHETGSAKRLIRKLHALG
jgi:AbiV family abortive infection protein